MLVHGMQYRPYIIVVFKRRKLISNLVIDDHLRFIELRVNFMINHVEWWTDIGLTLPFLNFTRAKMLHMSKHAVLFFQKIKI